MRKPPVLFGRSFGVMQRTLFWSGWSLRAGSRKQLQQKKVQRGLQLSAKESQNSSSSATPELFSLALLPEEEQVSGNWCLELVAG